MINKKIKRIYTEIFVGWFLALRQIKRSSKWTTVLISLVMTLTFINLVVVGGILVGLIEGASRTYRAQYSGDVLIVKRDDKRFIERTSEFINRLNSLDTVNSFSARYIVGGSVEANYQTRTRMSDAIDEVSVMVAGIDPDQENVLSQLSSLVVEGEYLNRDDFGKVLIGAWLLDDYSPGPSALSLSNVGVGSKVRVEVDNKVREVTVKGIIKSKVDEVSRRIYFNDRELRGMIGRTDYNVGEIAVRLNKDIDPEFVKKQLAVNNLDQAGLIQTWEESQGQFFKDISNTFQLLGDLLGAIGLAVASITIFIVIFVNAITRRKYIGIMKGIGVSSLSIEISYVFQSMFYALTGSILGVIILYVFLQPYVAANPIDFPFSDGILVAPLAGTLSKIGLLFLTTMIAGFIPARMIIRKNTLDAILGR